MNVKIKDLMVEQVITAQPHHSVEHVRGLMERNHISAVPVVGPEGEAVGIVSATDLIADPKAGTPVSQIMTERVYTVPAYNDAHVAARVMRNHKIHHVVVTHEKEVVGIISSFDLLQLVEDHRFVMKAAPAKGGKAQRG
jgi:CBS domain-containing protein